MESRDKGKTRTAIAPGLPATTHGRDVLSALAAAWFSSHETPRDIATPIASVTPTTTRVSPAMLKAAGPNVSAPSAVRSTASAPPVTRRARAR